jgi:aminoglycoside phosphotransferase (APT) family kinase protein
VTARDLEEAASGYLQSLTGAAEVLRALYQQPDRAVYLAERSRIVLKVYADGATLDRERAVARRASSAGVPVAEIVGFAAGPPAVLALRQVVGRPLAAELPGAARDAGVQLARFHRLGAQPPFADGELRWEAFVLARVARELASLRRLRVLDDGECGAIRRRFDRIGPDLARRPVVLLHGDLQPDHVIVDARTSRVVALLDFADAQPGDPLLDIAVLTLWERGLAGPVLAGYGSIDDGVETQRLLAHYRLLRFLGEVPWLLERGYDELAARSTGAIKAALAAWESLR